MKTLKKLAALLLIPAVYYIVLSGFSSKGTSSGYSVNPPPDPEQRNFINGILNNGPNTNPNEWITGQLSMYKGALNFNTIHSYDEIGGSGYHQNGTNNYGWFDEELQDFQKTNITNLTNSISEGEHLNFIYERSKISKLCYGQRLVYEVSSGGSTTLNNGFCYAHCDGEYTTDQNRTVLHLCPNPQQCNEGDATPRDIAWGIYENLQFGDLPFWNVQLADAGTWHVKPMMKIDRQVAFQHPDYEVIRIEVYNYNGNNTHPPTPIKTITIKAGDFIIGGNYDGGYIDVYSLPSSELQVTGGDGKSINNPPQLNDGQQIDYWKDWDTNCKIDFKVHWLGQVEVWFDKMTVDDEIANELFKPSPNIYESYIEDELDYYFSGNPRNYIFFADECLYSNIPCVKYVQDKINAYSLQQGQTPPVLLTASTQFREQMALRNNNIASKGFLETVQPKMYQIDSHEIYGWDDYVFIPNCLQNQSDPRLPASWFKSSVNYNNYLQDWVFGYANQTIQFHEQGSLICQINRAKQQIADYSPDTKLIVQPELQGNVFESTNSGSNYFAGGGREPTDEEILAQAMLSIARGADGIDWYVYQTFGWEVYPVVQKRVPPGVMTSQQQGGLGIMHIYGMLDELNPASPRRSNLYGQDKWVDVGNMNAKIGFMKPYIDQVKVEAAFSTHAEGVNHSYIDDIQSIGYQNPYNKTNPFTDASNERYWEMSFMGLIQPYFDEYHKYFMMVNRRCVPFYDNGGNDKGGDLRTLKIQFDNGVLVNFNNWKVYDVLHPDQAVVFDKRNHGFVEVSDFNPGDGKLFKLEPAIISGGTLAADEIITSDKNITILDTLFTNGYNLTIEDGAHISFTDTSAIVVNGGSFTAGTSASINPVIFNTVGKGLTFNNAEVRIYNSLFSGINDDTSYAVNLINCPVVDIRSSTFNAGSNSYSGGINMTYYSEPVINNIYLGYNTFDAGTSTIPFVNIMAYSGTTVPALIEHNTFTSTAGAMALMLSGVTGGAMKSNTFTDFARSVSALSSSIDVYGNTFTNESAASTGLEGLSGTELRLNKVSRTFIGGLNNFSNNQSSSRNILVDYSYYLLDGGENVFNIGSDNESKHLRGSFPYPVPVSTNATVNCFKINQSVSNPVVDVTSNGSPVSFVFTPYLSGCDPNGGGDEMVIELGDGIYDTVSIMSGAGGQSIANGELRIANLKSEIKNSQFEIGSKQLYDSICIQMRYRNYSYVKDRCEYMLNAYPDSLESIYAAHKLYLAVSVTDTTSSGRTALKTLYETIILNHPNNTSLVQKCNYLAQKCKVLLHQYSAALAGFQQIINNNPYSYEGLVAHWDYMATSLLVNGQGGGEGQESMTNDELRMTGDKSISNFGLSIANLKSRSEAEIPSYRDDESGDPNDKFTKEERKQINKTVTQSYESTKESGQKKIEMLTKQAVEGNMESAKQVKMMKTLEQVVTTQKPKNLFEHINIVKNDLKRVFGSDNSGKNKTNNIIPNQYSLSQNYPNPFNPETTIKYALPRDVKVLIKIYDILGREVQTLVNEFKKAGYYEIKFNGSNFASGVYFYRIESGDFVVSKKMVLIK